MNTLLLCAYSITSFFVLLHCLATLSRYLLFIPRGRVQTISFFRVRVMFERLIHSSPRLEIFMYDDSSLLQHSRKSIVSTVGIMLNSSKFFSIKVFSLGNPSSIGSRSSPTFHGASNLGSFFFVHCSACLRLLVIIPTCPLLAAHRSGGW